jgi:hypothetical protein
MTIKGQLPVFIVKKLAYLSNKMIDEFDRGDTESAIRTGRIYDCILSGCEQLRPSPVNVTICNHTVRRLAE